MPHRTAPPKARLIETRSVTPAKAPVSRAWLYVLALVVLGALVTPIALEHRGISRREKLFIIALGCLQTLAAVLVFAAFVVRMIGWFRSQLGQ